MIIHLTDEDIEHGVVDLRLVLPEQEVEPPPVEPPPVEPPIDPPIEPGETVLESTDYTLIAEGMDLPKHGRTSDDHKEWLGARPPRNDVAYARNISLVNDPSGKTKDAYLQVRGYKGQTGIGRHPTCYGVAKRAHMTQAFKNLSGDTDDVFLLYEVFIPSGFIFPRAIKGIGLSGNGYDINSERTGALISAVAGGFKGNTDSDCYKSTMRENGAFTVNNIYGLGHGRAGSGDKIFGVADGDIANLPTTDKEARDRDLALFQPGELNQVIMHCGLNDNGRANGILECWLNGEKVIQKRNMEWRSAKYPQTWSRRFFVPWYGGNNPGSHCHQDQSLYFRRIQVTTDYPD